MTTSRYNVDDVVVYGNYGLCTVTDIRKMDPTGTSVPKDYYVLKPRDLTASTYFLPADSEMTGRKLRQVLTKTEIDDMLEKAKEHKLSWIDDKTVRTARFTQILHAGTPEEMLLMVRCIREKKQELSDTGRKLPSSVDSALRTATQLINQEFSYALSIPSEEVGGYIRNVFL